MHRASWMLALVACGPVVSIDGDPDDTGGETPEETSMEDPDTGSAPAPDLGDAPAGCGDATVQGAEACDDGNAELSDGCNPDCTLAPVLLSRRTVGECLYADIRSDLAAVALSVSPPEADHAFEAHRVGTQDGVFAVPVIDGEPHGVALLDDGTIVSGWTHPSVETYVWVWNHLDGGLSSHDSLLDADYVFGFAPGRAPGSIVAAGPDNTLYEVAPFSTEQWVENFADAPYRAVHHQDVIAAVAEIDGQYTLDVYDPPSGALLWTISNEGFVYGVRTAHDRVAVLGDSWVDVFTDGIFVVRHAFDPVSVSAVAPAPELTVVGSSERLFGLHDDGTIVWSEHGFWTIALHHDGASRFAAVGTTGGSECEVRLYATP